MMESALIVSSTEKGIDVFAQLLKAAQVHHFEAMRSCGEARRRLLERDFDLVVINAPLRDEVGENLARQVAGKHFAQVILVVKAEHFDAVAAVCEDEGVLTIEKPLNRAVFWSALKLAKSTQNRLRREQVENQKLKQKIEDIRIVDRAKGVLITYENLSEAQAHRVIEKQAMNSRSTKRAVAEEILQRYEK